MIFCGVLRSLEAVEHEEHLSPRPDAGGNLLSEIGRRVGDVSIVTDAVVTNPSFTQIYGEYNKYLMARAAGLVGL